MARIRRSVRGQTAVKPRPDVINDYTHWYHDPTASAVGQDRMAVAWGRLYLLAPFGMVVCIGVG